jgi:hypothetical protein
MSNELNNIVSKATNGVLEGVAIGGDRYPGTNFMDHILRYQADPQASLGLVGIFNLITQCKLGLCKAPGVTWNISLKTKLPMDLNFAVALQHQMP